MGYQRLWVRMGMLKILKKKLGYVFDIFEDHLSDKFKIC